jgi:hypothetical protein
MGGNARAAQIMSATETAEALRQSRQLANSLIARGGKDDWQLHELAAEEAPHGVT